MPPTPDLIRRIARGCIRSGTTALLIAAIDAIAYYGFGVTFRSRTNGVYGAPSNLTFWLPLLVCGGLFLIAAGAAVLTWRRSPTRTPP